MKFKSTKPLNYALALLLVAGVGLAQTDQKSQTLRQELSKVATAEVPAKAAEIVTKTKRADRDKIAAEVIKAVFKAHPTITVATVGMISTKSPESAPAAAAAAANLQPKQAGLIARAAAAAAPAQAGAIVKAVCKVVPNHREVALAVADAAPEATLDIIEALGELQPEVKARLDLAVASFSGKVPSVAAVLYRANTGNAASVAGGTPTALASTGSRGPSVSAPYLPLLGTPTYVPPTGGVVPPGGRDYAAP